jgi:thiosulfate dehydrogenase [quinone] large subunit
VTPDEKQKLLKLFCMKEKNNPKAHTVGFNQSSFNIANFLKESLKNWKDPQELSLIFLRLFIGITFVFAGLQKLANPNFLNPKSTSSITAQMASYSRTSPIGGLLKHLIEHSQFIGLCIALGELAVGIGILFGLLTRLAAFGGMLISLSLFLSVSFNANPYYTGSDIVFFFSFTPFLIKGSSYLSIDQVIKAYLEHITYQKPSKIKSAVNEKRRLILTTTGYVAGLTGLLGAFVATIGRLLYSPSNLKTATLNLPSSSNPISQKSTSTNTSATQGQTTASNHGYLIGQANQVPVGQAATFTDPVSGDPAYIYRESQGNFVAFDAICPHAGCTVSPYVSQKLAVCPCHGSEFDLITGVVISGPAQSNLTPINVNYDASSDNLYVTN